MRGVSTRRAPLALAVALALGVGSAQAATITVTDGGDAGDGTTCTLRQAMQAANTDTAVGTCAAGSGADTIAFASALDNATITLAGNQLEVADNTTLTVTGNGQTLNAVGASRGLYVGKNATLTASNLSIKNGTATTPIDGPGSALNGGGIGVASNATVHLSVDLFSNSAPGNGGALAAASGATVTLSGGTIYFNTAESGGAVYTENSTVTVTGTSFFLNKSTRGSGGTMHFSGTQGSVSIVGTSFTGNTAATDGGAIDADVPLTIASSDFDNNDALNNGGAIYSYSQLDVNASTFSSNTAGSYGGAIDGGKPASISTSTFDDNVALDSGGAISTGHSLDLVNSTLTGNAAITAGAVYGDFSGKYSAQMSLTNVTISGNDALDSGGGLFVELGTDSDYNSTVQLHNTVLAANRAPAQPDLRIDGTSGSVEVVSSLLGSALQPDYSGSGNIFTDVPKLGDLQDNGGPTKTMLPLPGSPLIDAGANSLLPPGTQLDQRGYIRVINGTVDIGAVEADSYSDTIFQDGFESP